MIRQILREVSTRVISGLAALGVVYRRARSGEESLLEELRAMRQRVLQLEQELGALCSASAGVGDHVVTLELQVQRITERQNLLELRTGSDRPYSQANQLVHNGADIDELVGTCGLTRGEAELLVMMERGSA
ncbi:MAG TPA: DUF2802 domain-containing protein [Gammaproteobacteria bacterium]|nr:DUF2802 domain-containing protein [Gammaproteobacteria bacterium]